MNSGIRSTGLTSQASRKTSEMRTLTRHRPVGQEVADEPQHVGYDAHEVTGADVARPEDPEDHHEERPGTEEAENDPEKDGEIHGSMRSRCVGRPERAGGLHWRAERAPAP